MPLRQRRRPSVTERTFYPGLLEIIVQKGGTGVQEITYNSDPDIQFELLGRQWLMPIKLGESPITTKQVFLQYLRHRRESGIQNGIMLLLSDELRKIRPEDAAIRSALSTSPVTVFVDAEPLKDEIRGRPFSEVLEHIIAAIRAGETRYYPLQRVISLLRQQVLDLMEELHLDQEVILKVVTDRQLLTSLAQRGQREIEAAAQFLAAYIVLSQALFLRLLVSAGLRSPSGHSVKVPSKITRKTLRKTIREVWDINYRPIFEIDVLDKVPENYLQDTFDLIWGLEIERVRHDLPGRIFHDLMPPEIRKLVAAFYTRPQAADLLAQLTVDKEDATIFDPACGSGTILVAAYRAKLEKHFQLGLRGKIHKRFCEEEIFGSDIMPFAQHLASANLAAMDVPTEIEHTQIINADSLGLAAGHRYSTSLRHLGSMFSQTGIGILSQTPAQALKTTGEEYAVQLREMDVILMNPPFTKIERGIAEFVDMQKFRQAAGGEVGLWGHFIVLANEFLKEKGTFGAVLPINILRGRESSRVRQFLFRRWTPTYILKSTLHYGFSEWAEYRDILLIASKQQPNESLFVKFCLLKRDLRQLSHADILEIIQMIREHDRVRSDDLDVDSYPLAEVWNREPNLMWFASGVDFTSRDLLVDFTRKFADLRPITQEAITTGIRLDAGLARVLFLTRSLAPSRLEQAFLRFARETSSTVRATTNNPAGREYEIPRSALVASLRTPVGQPRMEISGAWDYLVIEPFEEYAAIRRAAGYRGTAVWPAVWDRFQRDARQAATRLCFVRRVNPFSPDTHHIAFFSHHAVAPSDQLNVAIIEREDEAKSLCVMMNSIIFLSQLFLVKEESTGRYMDVRLYDLQQIRILPPANVTPRMDKIFDDFGREIFPSLAQQLDANFYSRYEEFWALQRERPFQLRLWTVLREPIRPSQLRIEMDLAVCRALGADISNHDLESVYGALVQEMIITRGLRKD